MSIKNVSIIGAGTMGRGIALVFATHGFNVKIFDAVTENLHSALENISVDLDRMIKKSLITENEKKDALSNIELISVINEAVQHADLVVEAVTENIEVKQKLFKQLDELCLPHCILATNTSSISITKLAASTTRPSQVIGMHFMNPVPVMPLVEIISGLLTSLEIEKTISEVTIQLSKKPLLTKDYPGFVANRILMPMINEAIYTLNDGVADVETIDQIMKLGMAHPMGPLELADFIGLDVCLSILKVLHQELGRDKYVPCPLLVKMVDARLLGVKSLQGFYKYTRGSKEKIPSPIFSK